jgi:hypothetical protein
MSDGGRGIEITFEAYILIKRKSMGPALSTGSSTARKIPSMFGATPLLSKNTKRADGKSNLSG